MVVENRTPNERAKEMAKVSASIEEMTKKLKGLAEQMQSLSDSASPLIQKMSERRAELEAYREDLEAVDDGRMRPIPIRPGLPVATPAEDYFNQARIREEDRRNTPADKYGRKL